MSRLTNLSISFTNNDNKNRGTHRAKKDYEDP